MDNRFFSDWVSDLHGGPAALLAFIGELRRSKVHAMDPISSGLATDVDVDVPWCFGPAMHELPFFHNADTADIHQAVPGVPLMEVDLSSKRRDSDTVAIITDTIHNTLKQVHRVFHSLRELLQGVIQRSEKQGINIGNWLGAHAEHVSDNTTHTSRSASVRFNRRRMIMRQIGRASCRERG